MHLYTHVFVVNKTISWITVLFFLLFLLLLLLCFCFLFFFMLFANKWQKLEKDWKQKEEKTAPHPLPQHTHTQKVFLFASVCLSAFYHDNVDLTQIPWSSRNCHQLWGLNMTRLPDSVSLCVCLSLSLSHTQRYWGRSTFADWEGSWPFLCNSFCVITCRLYIFLL